jgi:hypothetical protein
MFGHLSRRQQKTITTLEYYYGDQSKENVTGGKFTMQGKIKYGHKILVGNPERKILFG